jgi:hypothetical protein
MSHYVTLHYKGITVVVEHYLYRIWGEQQRYLTFDDVKSHIDNLERTNEIRDKLREIQTKMNKSEKENN